VADLEVDGNFKIQMELIDVPTYLGADVNPFITTIDLHYLSSNIGTVDKAPDFNIPESLKP
jgi:hypothetical protein